MWSEGYELLSQLAMRDERIASVAWYEGALYFCLRTLGEDTFCREHAITVGAMPQLPNEETQLLEGTRAERLYILSDGRAWQSCTCGQSWEEM